MFEVLRIYKIGRFLKKSKILGNLFFKINRILNSCHIHPECNLGKGVQFTHGGIGIVINRRMKFGDNVSIGKNAVIGAMSFVNKNVPPNTIWAGVPARQIGIIDEK